YLESAQLQDGLMAAHTVGTDASRAVIDRPCTSVGTRLSRRLDQSIAVGLMVVLFFTTLAHGAVEPWSIAVFELMLIGILLLWGIKITIERRLYVNIPSAALPILALMFVGILQSIAFTGGDGQRLSLSMDVEA